MSRVKSLEHLPKFPKISHKAPHSRFTFTSPLVSQSLVADIRGQYRQLISHSKLQPQQNAARMWQEGHACQQHTCGLVRGNNMVCTSCSHSAMVYIFVVYT